MNGSQLSNSPHVSIMSIILDQIKSVYVNLHTHIVHLSISPFSPKLLEIRTKLYKIQPDWPIVDSVGNSPSSSFSSAWSSLSHWRILLDVDSLIFISLSRYDWSVPDFDALSDAEMDVASICWSTPNKPVVINPCLSSSRRGADEQCLARQEMFPPLRSDQVGTTDE